MSVKYLQNLSAISIGSVNFLPSDLNDVGRDELLLRQVVLRSFRGLYTQPKVTLFSVGNNNFLEK